MHGMEQKRGLVSMARSARRAARGFRNIERFETVVFLRPGCLDVSAQLAVSNILPLESPPRVSIAPLTVDLRLPSQGRKKGRSSPLHPGRLQSHSSRCRMPLAEELYGRHPVVSVQPPGGFGTQAAEQLQCGGNRREGRELCLGRVEQALGVCCPVPHAEHSVQQVLELLPSRPLRPRATEARPPHRGLAGAVGEMDPESQRLHITRS
jgi:hypothetical protein